VTLGPVHNRPLTLDEWQRRLNNTRDLIDGLDEALTILITEADDSDPVVKDAIHAAVGKLSSLRSHVSLAQRRIDRGLV
jgi:hypothetical protein